MKKIFGIMIVTAVAMIAGYNIYSSHSDLKLSELALANIEALASDVELPEVGLTCSQIKNTSGGRCWTMRGDCFMRLYEDCKFSGYQNQTCLTPCD